MEKKNVYDFSIEELNMVIDASDNFKNLVEFKSFLINIKKVKEKDRENDLNNKFDLKMFEKLNIFTPYELEILKQNNINNLRDLLDMDLKKLPDVPNEILRHFDWVRNFYNADSYQREFLDGRDDFNGKRK